MSGFNRLQHLCTVSRRACDILSPLVVQFYHTINSETAKLKSDASVFTIADGLVQHLLSKCLFSADKFSGIVGEEDDVIVNISDLPYKVDDLTVPNEFVDIINHTKEAILQLSNDINSVYYNDLTIFIDPIDGTREFSTGLGEQCSICIGFSDPNGLPAAGIVYRPITSPPTWAAGAKSENYFDSVLDLAPIVTENGFLTSNGGISPFIVNLIKELNFNRVPSGGAGNKMLMLIEGKGSAYIQDRGVSRWGKLLINNYYNH
jgi:3'(2'), 5'-bisphosphate nucleotidase